MSYGVYRTVTHKNLPDGTTYLIEVLKNGFAGSPVELKGRGPVFNHDYEKIDRRNPLEKPVQKSRLELFINVGAQAELDLLKEIFNATEGEYRLRKKVNGAAKWTGVVLSDLLDYGEEGFPTEGKIVAKDLSVGEAKDFLDGGSLPTGREKLIVSLSSMLSEVLPLDIHTYTSWSNSTITEANDFLDQIYNDRHNYRIYGAGGEQDEPITVFEALERFCKNYRLIIRQSGGVWNIYQLSALSNPSNVTRFVYNSSGVFQSSSSVDITTSFNSGFVLPESRNILLPGVKRTRVKFDHRTTVQNITYPEEIIIEDSGSDIRSQFFNSDGNQSLQLSGVIRAEMREGATESKVTINIRIDQDTDNYWWNGSDWVQTSSTIEKNLTDQGGDIWQSGIDIQTSNIPADAAGTLVVSINNATGDTMPGAAHKTRLRSFDLTIRNPSIAEGDNTSIDYRLTQSANLSYALDEGDIWFGDGPTSYSRAALSSDSGGQTLTAGNWGRRGGVLDRDVFEVWLEELIHLFRGVRESLDGTLYGDYEPGDVFVKDSKNLFFLGGSQNGKENRWSGTWFEINISDATDTYEVLYKTGAVSGTTAGGPDGGGATGSIDWGSVTGKPFSSVGSNLEVTSGALGVVNIPNLTALDIGGTRAIDSSRNLDVGDISLSGKFLSPVDFSFRNAGDTALRSISIGQASSTNHAVAGGRTISSGDGLSGGGDLTTDRTLSVNPTAPITLTAGQVDLSFNDPLYLNASNLDVRVHGSGQSGVILASAQNIFGAKDFQANATFESNIILDDATSQVNTKTFAGGFGGSGVRWNPISGSWELTTDDLVVRNRIRAYELAIERVRSVGGTLIVNEGMTSEEVSQLGDSTWSWDDNTIFPFSDTQPDPYFSWSDHYRFFPEEDILIEFTENDLIRRQNYTGRDIALTEATVFNLETGNVDPEVNTPRRYFDGYLRDGTDAPVDEMDLVRIGNLTDAGRQNGIIITASDSGNPYRRIYAGVDSFSRFGDFDTLRLQDGRLDNIIDPDFPTLDGTQTNLFGIWTNGGFFNNVEVRGTITILDADASNAATKAYVDEQSGEAASVVQRTGTEPVERPSGEPLNEGDIWVDTSDGDRPYSWNGTSWIRAYTSITGGDLVTGTITANEIDVDDLYAANATVTATLTLGTGAEFVNSGNTLLMDGTTFVYGGSASSQTLTSGTGIFMNTSGHFRAGSTSGGALTEGISWDGTNFLLEATNTSIDSSGNLTATNATLSGAVTATSGSFSGVTISGVLTMGASGEITSSNYTLDDDGIFTNRSIRFEINSVTVTGPGSIDNANYGDRGILKVNNNAGGTDPFQINGLQNGVDGLIIQIISSGTGPVVLAHEAASSSASNRFDTYDDSDLVLNSGRSAYLVYDGDISRWRAWSFVT